MHTFTIHTNTTRLYIIVHQKISKVWRPWDLGLYGKRVRSIPDEGEIFFKFMRLLLNHVKGKVICNGNSMKETTMYER